MKFNHLVRLSLLFIAAFIAHSTIASPQRASRAGSSAGRPRQSLSRPGSYGNRGRGGRNTAFLNRNNMRQAHRAIDRVVDTNRIRDAATDKLIGSMFGGSQNNQQGGGMPMDNQMPGGMSGGSPMDSPMPGGMSGGMPGGSPMDNQMPGGMENGISGLRPRGMPDRLPPGFN